MARLFVLDPHPVTRLGIQKLLEPTGHTVVGDASDASAAIRSVESGDVDLIVLTAAFTEAVANRFRDMPVVLFDDDAPPRLPSSIRIHVRKSADASALCDAIDSVIGVAQRAAPHRRLSRREREILSMILEGQRPKEIGHSLGLSPKTVSTHRRRIFRKLDVESDVGLVRYALRHGLAS